ncbi:MAG: hypothetical protein AM1032_000229 [Mycoplasmataceae bacterium]|nr:MAG: hypothetical protein AM1032_000229 [Mycoplasmataceae bacterium]
MADQFIKKESEEFEEVTSKKKRFRSASGQIITTIQALYEKDIPQHDFHYEEGIFFTTVRIGKEAFKGDFENSFWFFLFAIFSNFAWLIYFLFFNKRSSDEEIEL